MKIVDTAFIDESSRPSNISAVMDLKIDVIRTRFPFCIVWTPIPILTYFFPFIGHMGIATSTGIIRDFAGPYHVSENKMTFGKPTKYCQLDHSLARGGVTGWDDAVTEASEIYKTRMHHLCCDNCHSHVATALNLMNFKNSSNWNMVKLALLIFFHGKYVDWLGFLKTWLPFFILIIIFIILCINM